MTTSILPSQRHLFTIPDDVTYLNCAFLSPQLNSVTEAGLEAVKLKQRAWEVGTAEFFPGVERLKELFAQLIDAQPQDIALVPSSSYGIATAAKNLPVQKGQTIVLLGDEFPSNVYSWHDLAKQTGAIVKTITRPVNDDWTTAILQNLDSNTAIAALSHSHWTDGSFIDLEKIGEVCKQYNIALVVDTTQSLGAVPFSVKKIPVDFMVASGYKWLLGPYGLSLMYVAPQRQFGTPIEFSWITRAGARDFSLLTQYDRDYEEGAGRYDMGQRSQFIHVPMSCAAIQQILTWGVDNIHASLQIYTNTLAERLQQMGIACVPQASRAGHMLGIKMQPHINMPALAAELRQQKIYISTPGTSNIRLAPHLYNTPVDQDRFLQALANLLAK